MEFKIYIFLARKVQESCLGAGKLWKINQVFVAFLTYVHVLYVFFLVVTYSIVVSLSVYSVNAFCVFTIVS